MHLAVQLADVLCLVNEVLAEGVPRDRRPDVLRELLKRVVVGRASVDLVFEWRD